MTTNTYRLAVTLQATAINIIDCHHGGVHTLHHSLGDFAVLARHRTANHTRSVHTWARDRDGDLIAAAAATTPADGGPITSHVTDFHGAHMRWTRRVIPTDEQYRSPAQLSVVAGAHIGFHASGQLDYFVVHDWAPGRDPHTTTWSLLAGTPRTGLELMRTRVDLDTAVNYANTLQTRCAAAG
jgi:hypothetical protein